MAAANGTYQMQFSLWDGLPPGGVQVGSTIANNSVTVTNGVFTVTLNFTASNAFDGSPRWLEIAVKKPADPSFVTLSPRQPLTSAPYAVKSLNAATAGNSLNLGGVAASDFVVTTDPRMADARSPLPGSSNYIQNTATLVPGDFNLIGSGAVSYAMSATQYNIGPNRILSIFDTNLFTGRDAGKDVLPGQRNSFFGPSTGSFINNGSDNSLLGNRAGNSLVGGNNNSYFGSNAGSFNDGNNNSFFGKDSGYQNQFTDNSTFLGYLAGANTSGLTNTTAIGARAMVSQSNSLVLGSINFINGATADTKVGIGTTAPSAKLHVAAFGPVRMRIDSDYGCCGDAGLTFALNEQNKWTANVQSDGFFRINNDSAGGTAFSISGSNNDVGIPGNLTVGGTINGSFSVATANNALNLGGIAAAQYVQTNDARLTDARNPLPNSANYIQNTTSQQTPSNFSISGNGTIGGTLALSSGTESAPSFTFTGNTDTGISRSSANTLNFSTSGVSRMQIAPNGNLGVGTSTPTFKLHVIDTSNTGLRVQTNIAGGTVASFGGNGTFAIDSPGIEGGRFKVTESGLVTIGRDSVGGDLTVYGNTLLNTVTVANGITLNALGTGGFTTLCRNASAQISNCSSSLRYKNNIGNFTSGLDLLKRLRPVSFTWKQGGTRDMGLVAEDVAQVEPLLVTRNEKGEVEGVKYDRLSIVLINAVKEQQATIQALQKQVNDQQAKDRRQQEQLDAQQKLIEGLRKLVCAQQSKAEICKEN